MEVYIIRHTPVLKEKNVCYGHTDVELSESFPDDLQQLKKQLPNRFDRVYSSPLQRCLTLAKALEFEDVVIDRALMEVNFGEWENKKWNDLDQHQLNTWMADFVNIRPPRGESLTDLYHRVTLFTEKLRSQNHDKVLIIAHAGVIRCILAYLLAIPLRNVFKIPVDYLQTFVVDLGSSADLDSIKKLG